MVPQTNVTAHWIKIFTEKFPYQSYTFKDHNLICFISGLLTRGTVHAEIHQFYSLRVISISWEDLLAT